MVGNPNFITASWGETTKAFKMPVRVGERIQELKESGEDADDILARLDSDGQASEIDLKEMIELLQSALELKSNAGGAIKTKIRQVLELLSSELE